LAPFWQISQRRDNESTSFLSLTNFILTHCADWDKGGLFWQGKTTKMSKTTKK
jgi:hypothetical protein